MTESTEDKDSESDYGSECLVQVVSYESELL